MSKRHASSKPSSQRPAATTALRHSSPLKKRKVPESDAATYGNTRHAGPFANAGFVVSDSSSTKFFAADKGAYACKCTDAPSDSGISTSTEGRKTHAKLLSKKLTAPPLPRTDEVEMDDLCPVCDDHCTCNRVGQKAAMVYHHHHHRNEPVTLREAYHFTPAPESGSEESAEEDAGHHVQVYASPRSKRSAERAARSSDEDRIISELAYAEDPFDSIDYYLFSNESEDEECWNTAQRSNVDLPPSAKADSQGYEEDMESSEYSDFSVEERGNNDEGEDEDEDEEIENQIIKDEEKMMAKSMKPVESPVLLASCNAPLQQSSPAINNKKRYSGQGRKGGDPAKVRKTLSTIDKELLLEALKQMSPDVLSSISKNLKKNKKEKKPSLAKREAIEPVKQESQGLPTPFYGSPPPTIIDNNANATGHAPSFMHSMAAQKSDEPGWIVRDYSSTQRLYPVYDKNSAQLTFAHRFVEHDVACEFEMSESEASLNFEDVLDTEACPISFSKDTEPNSKIDPVSRWDRIPIGTFRRSRRLSVPLLRYTDAFKDPGSNYDPWINGTRAQPHHHSSNTSARLQSIASASFTEAPPCYYEQVTAWCLLSDSTRHLRDEILLVEGSAPNSNAYFTGLQREPDDVACLSNSLYTCGGHVDSSPESKMDFSLLY